MDLEALRTHRFEPRRCAYTDRDTLLYALSVGAGSAEFDQRELALLYERDLVALPTMAAVLAHPGAWIADHKFGVRFEKLLHGEQRLTVHNPLQASGELEAGYEVVAVKDKGEGKGALLYFEKRLLDVSTGRRVCTVLSTYFLRGDGGCGSFGLPPDELPEMPTEGLRVIGELVTDRRAALLYRLNGDRNPLHVDPAFAAKAGFKQPILQGLCTYGISGYLIARHLCDFDVTRLRTLSARFTSPVYPGETIRLEALAGARGVSFQARVVERDCVVLGQGLARLS
jgi:acyl dehydratase